jgi:hypothetical protein
MMPKLPVCAQRIAMLSNKTQLKFFVFGSVQIKQFCQMAQIALDPSVNHAPFRVENLQIQSIQWRTVAVFPKP